MGPAKPTALLSQIWSSRPSKLAKHCASSARDPRHAYQELRIKLARIESLLVQEDRTFIVKILIRFSNAYADLALWIAPWVIEEDGASR